MEYLFGVISTNNCRFYKYIHDSKVKGIVYPAAFFYLTSFSVSLHLIIHMDIFVYKKFE